MTNYWVSAVNMQPVPTWDTFFASDPNPFIPPPADGEPVAFIRTSNASDVVSAWSWAADDTTLSDAGALSLLKTTLSKLNRANPGATTKTVPIADSDVKAFTKVDYFPRWNTKQLQAGVYEKYYALQGQKNTYFTSGLDGFELVEFAVRSAKNLVANHF